MDLQYPSLGLFFIHTDNDTTELAETRVCGGQMQRDKKKRKLHKNKTAQKGKTTLDKDYAW